MTIAVDRDVKNQSKQTNHDLVNVIAIRHESLSTLF